MPSNSPGRPSGETPPSTDAAPRVSGKRTLKHSGDGGAPLAGIRTCRQELADRRGWSTFSKAWPVRRSDTAVARREAHVFFERGARLTERVSRLIGAPRPRHSCRGKDSPGTPCPGAEGDEGVPGADKTIRAAERWLCASSASPVTLRRPRSGPRRAVSQRSFEVRLRTTGRVTLSRPSS